MLSDQGLESHGSYMEWVTPLELWTKGSVASNVTRDRDAADTQHNCGAETEAEAREEDDMQIEPDALSHETRDRDPADAQLDCAAEKEGPARQEGGMQIELDALFNDFSKEDNISMKSNHQEFDRLAARETALIHQLKEVQHQYSLLARTDLTRTPKILERPDEEIEAIVTRGLRFTQSTSDVEAARILDSKNSDLPIGLKLIADVSANVYILVDGPSRVHIFDKADILCIEHDTMFRVRLVMKEGSLRLCDAMHAHKSWLCEKWVNKYAEGVEATYVRGRLEGN